MPAGQRYPVAARACSGLIAGLAVGGGVALVGALQAGLGLIAFVATVLLGASTLWLFAGILGAFWGALLGCARWGRQGQQARQWQPVRSERPADPEQRSAAGYASSWRAQVAAQLLVGVIPGALAGGAVWITARRVNRFMSAGVVTAAALAGALVAVLLAPALARLIAQMMRKRHLKEADKRGAQSDTTRQVSARNTGAPNDPVDPVDPVIDSPQLLGLALALLVLLGSVFALIAQTRSPLLGAARWERLTWSAGLSALVPLLGAAVAKLFARWAKPLVRMPPWRLGAGLVLFGAGTLGWVAWVRWERDMQFVPWRHLLTAAACAVVAIFADWMRQRWFGSYCRQADPAEQAHAGGADAADALVGPDAQPSVAPQAPASRRLGAGFWLGPLGVWVLLPLAVPIVLLTAESEPARKTVTRAVGLVGPVLAQARRVLDFDRDGYPGFLGGGDCNDHNATINPEAVDWPDDNIDQDCDGEDASLSVLKPHPFFPVPEAVPERLNILLVAIDTIRADHLGSYGYHRETTPHLDALARQGSLFENGWAHAPSTRYSMPALMTGRYPSAIDWNMSMWWPGINPSSKMLAEILQPLGYVNGALWAYEYFNPNARRGFERAVPHYQAHRAALHRNVGGPAESEGSSARQIADDALAFIEARAGEAQAAEQAGAQPQPFFLTTHFYDPHLNYQKHPESPDFGGEPLDRYDNEIHFTDAQIGRVFEHLKQLGLWDKTVIVVTGDHGEGLGERGISAHGYHLYPPQTKVPFIVRVPGLAPRRIKTPAAHVDVAPTLLNVIRGQPYAGFMGRSLVDLLAGGPEDAARAVFQEVSYEGNNKKRALATATHQLVWNWTPHNTTECYELAQGPEGPDLWGTGRSNGVCSSLKRRLRQKVALLSLPAGYAERVASSVFASPDEAPALPRSLKPPVVFGDPAAGLVRLVGWSVNPFPPQRGQRAEIELHFDVLKEIPAGWKLFMHLQGPGGFMNLDHAVVGGAYPLARWKPGQRIVDRHTFLLPANRPPGAYLISVGFWRGVERLSLSPEGVGTPDKRLVVTQFQVP